MLLRFTVENFRSFKDATEFNTFPSSKSHSHNNHKVDCGHATILRMSAIYGANGAGKSNLLIAIDCLKNLVNVGSIKDLAGNVAFKLSDEYQELPSEFAVEFAHNDNIFYYHIAFNRNKVVSEELSLSKKTVDSPIFTRNNDNIEINQVYASHQINDQFIDLIKRMVRPDMLLISFLGELYPNEVPFVTEAYKWFVENLQILIPEHLMGGVPHFLDKDAQFAEMVAKTIPELKTGIAELKVKKDIITDEDAKNNSKLLKAVNAAKNEPGVPQLYIDSIQGDACNIVCEDGIVYRKSLVAVHRSVDGKSIDMPISLESDGTRRLIDYMPLIYLILNERKVFIVDEIERSIHPILIKAIVTMLSESKSVAGQLIFTTHESCLLDQNIFRPDEIWFAEKDLEQSTQLYPLSDYNIHKTANIENGYLNGRYGGIPFLSNINDLHW